MHDIDRQLNHMLRGEFDKGWELSEKIEKIGPDEILDPTGKKNPEMWLRHQFNRGWFLLQQGKYQEGSQLLESGRFLSVYGGGFLKTSAPIYNPSEHKLEGKSVILSLEGGYGDEIIHARFATSLKKLGAAKVYIAAAPEIAGVFTRIEGLDGVILRDQAHTVQHDYWVPGFSAGWICGHTYDNIPSDPYIKAIPSSMEIWKSVIKSDKKKVGIRWAGNPKFEHQQFRRFPPEFLINLEKYSDLQIYSFQRDHNVQSLPENIVDLQHLLISWEDTLAALSLMDIVITSCTSVAHAAAALGKETWVFTPILPYHTWTLNAPYSTTSPYYKCVKLYRQKDHRSWNEPFQQMYRDLEEKFSLPHLDLPNCDKEFKKLNLGCGFLKFKDALNVDHSPICKPDKIVDLNKPNWDLETDGFDHIIAKDILEHLDDPYNTIKEMYRISRHGAIWEIQIPHHRCDIAYDNPTHKCRITPGTFRLFNMKDTLDKLSNGIHCDGLGLEDGIDIEVCEIKFDYIDTWLKKFQETNASLEEIDYAVNHLSNVVANVMILVQVHKPARYSREEIEKVIAQYDEGISTTAD